MAIQLNPGRGGEIIAGLELGGEQYQVTVPFLIEVARSHIEGQNSISGWSMVHKFGLNTEIDTGTDADIWDLGINGAAEDYTYDATAQTLYVSSDEAGDSGATYQVTLVGLDENWESQEATVQLDGQTAVEVSGKLWKRIFRMYSDGSAATAGNVYAAINSTATGNGGVPTDLVNARAYFASENQQTLMAIYTVPAGKIALLTMWWATILKGGSKTGDVKLFRRDLGKTFRLLEHVGLAAAGVSAWQHDYSPPHVFDERTDIKVRGANMSASDTEVSAGFCLILVDKEGLSSSAAAP
jgi:hypothetical protein